MKMHDAQLLLFSYIVLTN